MREVRVAIKLGLGGWDKGGGDLGEGTEERRREEGSSPCKVGKVAWPVGI